MKRELSLLSYNGYSPPEKGESANHLLFDKLLNIAITKLIAYIYISKHVLMTHKNNK
ncbi:MAG: hypothetical protein ACI8WT_002116 [Clostridium sp.]|jgi:hypothetical protein